MPNYCLRIDTFGDNEEVSRNIILAFMLDVVKASGLGCVECPEGQNLHYHFMFMSIKKIDAVRKAIQKFLKDNNISGGNAAYSLNNKTGSENYICKGYVASKLYKNTNFPHYDPKTRSTPQIIFNTEGYSDQDIQCYHEDFWNSQKELKKPTRTPTQEDKQSSFMRKVTYIKSKGITYDAIKMKKKNRIDICVELIHYYRHNQSCRPNEFQVKLMTESIYEHIIFEEDPKAFEAYATRMAKSLFGLDDL